MPHITFTFADGQRRRVFAAVGDSVMDAALDNHIAGITAQCGGGCTCCTCHCYVDEAWFDRFPEPHPDEAELLTYAWRPDARSRLSCQLELQAGHEGLEVEVPAEQA